MNHDITMIGSLRDPHDPSIKFTQVCILLDMIKEKLTHEAHASGDTFCARLLKYINEKEVEIGIVNEQPTSRRRSKNRT